jgi:prenyltransferase beta subunit
VNRRLKTLATTVALAAVVAAAASRAAAVTVSLRVESSTAASPLYEGTITTLPHPVDGGDGSGVHPCSGPPGEAPAATATGALDDAMRAAGISWRGNWDPNFRDFFIDRIGPYASAAPDSYWSLSVNGRFTAGGCLTRVSDGDAIRFFYGPLFGGSTSGGASGGQEGIAGEGASPAHSVGTSPQRLRRIAGRAAQYLELHKGPGENWARLALAIRRRNRSAAAAASLLGGRLDSQGPDGSLDGDVNATAIAVLALLGNQPRRAARAGTWLATRQGQDGGFGYRAGAPADVDTTALTTWALALTEKQRATRLACAYIRAAQNGDGGFPSTPGASSNAQSTGLAAIALRVCGVGPRQAVSAEGLGPLDFLASLSRRDGSIAYSQDSHPTPVWTTAQALLGLSVGTKLLAVAARP